VSYQGYFYSMQTDNRILATANSSGVATGYIGPVPEGFCWYVERYTTKTNSSGSPTCEVYSISSQTVGPDILGRQDYTATGKNDISDNLSAVWVGPGMYLVAVWQLCTSGDLCQLSTQIRVHELPPVVATPYDLAQLTQGPLVPVYEPVGPE
jgi:hypothetical protein